MKVSVMQMINWLQSWLLLDDTKLLYVLALILFASTFDFLLGWVNARFNSEVLFSSSQARFGISMKIAMFILLVYFIPVALLVPEPIGISALYVLYIGYLLSEINSILGHLKITEDDKKNELFGDFILKIFTKNENKGAGE